MKEINPISFTLPTAQFWCDWTAFVFDMGVFIMKKKRCNTCGDIKSLKDFYRDKSCLDGFEYRCKKCASIKDAKYSKTKIGLITRMYNDQKACSKRREYPVPTYSKNELKEWLFSQKLFHELFDNWKKGGYEKNLTPSCDRKDDYKSYTFDNIQLMTWGENEDKGNKDRKNGINNKKSKAVLQFDINGGFIKEYYSIAEAGRRIGTVGSNIIFACQGKYSQAGGFIWKYKNNKESR
jgi:hypothetical protein